MASTTAMYTGLSGMTANARRLDVIGNNIANANTTGFKSSRLMFESQFARTIRDGTAPQNEDGGSNPYQIGLGVNVAGTQRDFSVGSISASGDPRDMAIQGRGFFITSRGPDTVYTRAGAFRQDVNGDLTNVEGDKLLGYGIDSKFNIQTGALQPLNIPIGKLTLVQATQNVQFDGTLKADGSPATHGSSIVLGGTPTAGLSLIPTATKPPTPPHLLETTSLLGEIADPQASSTPLFMPGQMIQVHGATRGTGALPDSEFTVGATSTVQDLMDFFRNALAIDTSAGPNPDGATPGVALDPNSGKLTITGNTGSVNDLEVASERIRLLDSTGNEIRSPFDSDKTASADGESVKVPIEVFDSLGQSVDAEVRLAMESKGNGGSTVWRYYVDSVNQNGQQPALATGTLSFDTDGTLMTTAPVAVKIDRASQGAASPLTFDLRFDTGPTGLRALGNVTTSHVTSEQDGAPTGTLSSFGVADDGTVVGVFDNGLSRPLGQVAIATFRNQEGLVDVGQNAFKPGADSGTASVTVPGENASGKIVSGALELSNVDLGQEFINMILTSTGYSASSRVIQTSDQLLQQLLVLGR